MATDRQAGDDAVEYRPGVPVSETGTRYGDEGAEDPGVRAEYTLYLWNDAPVWRD
eukprot:gene240-5711_t